MLQLSSPGAGSSTFQACPSVAPAASVNTPASGTADHLPTGEGRVSVGCSDPRASPSTGSPDPILGCIQNVRRYNSDNGNSHEGCKSFKTSLKN